MDWSAYGLRSISCLPTRRPTPSASTALQVRYRPLTVCDESTFLWIRDWKPDSFFTAEEVEVCLAGRLHALVGRTLEEVWVVWDVTADEWFCDAPVLLVVGGCQIEVSVHQIDELCVSFDAIDRSAPFGWLDDPEFHFDLDWRCNPAIVPESVIGRRVVGFGAAEYAFELADFVGTRPWVLVSFEVELEGGAHLAIENGLDENAFRFRSPEKRDDLRVKWFESASSRFET